MIDVGMVFRLWNFYLRKRKTRFGRASVYTLGILTELLYCLPSAPASHVLTSAACKQSFFLNRQTYFPDEEFGRRGAPGAHEGASLEGTKLGLDEEKLSSLDQSEASSKRRHATIIQLTGSRSLQSSFGL